jgi:hypothetical protein
MQMIKDYIMKLLKTQKGVALVVPLVVLAVVGIIGYSAHLITKKDDGVVEEMAEDFIQEETGENIDLTPNSPEKKTDA